MSSWTVDWEDLLYLKTTRKKTNYLDSLLETSLGTVWRWWASLPLPSSILGNNMPQVPWNRLVGTKHYTCIELSATDTPGNIPLTHHQWGEMLCEYSTLTPPRQQPVTQTSQTSQYRQVRSSSFTVIFHSHLSQSSQRNVDSFNNNRISTIDMKY